MPFSLKRLSSLVFDFLVEAMGETLFFHFTRFLQVCLEAVSKPFHDSILAIKAHT